MQESLRSYVQRFNAKSLKLDIPEEKFAITAFIAGLGVHSKDLMLSISKNPQASIAEVLAKTEKYINDEEALISKKGSSSIHKEKSGTDKRQGWSPKIQRYRERSPKKDSERFPEKTWKSQRSPRSTSARTATTVFTLAVYPPDDRSIVGLAQGTTRTVSEMAIPD